MMETLTQQVLAMVATLVIVMAPMAAGVWFLLRRKRQARRERRSPLTGPLLRMPGHALRERLDEARIDTALEMVFLMVAPAIGLSVLFAQSLVSGKLMPAGFLTFMLILLLGFTAYQVRSLMRRSVELDQLRLGLDAEVAVGQELDQLMRQGAWVFHDLAGDKFNIDHVVVAPQGVFAVETKGYRKPNRKGGTADATVAYDGQALKFPDWSSDKPLLQAQRQARWLSEWLSSATGEPIEVAPVLALPGWYVDRKGRGPVAVLSGPDLQRHLLKARDARALSAEQVQRVAHQVERRCRDVEPGYRAEDEAR